MVTSAVPGKDQREGPVLVPIKPRVPLPIRSPLLGSLGKDTVESQLRCQGHSLMLLRIRPLPESVFLATPPSLQNSRSLAACFKGQLLVSSLLDTVNF